MIFKALWKMVGELRVIGFEEKFAYYSKRKSEDAHTGSVRSVRASGEAH